MLPLVATLRQIGYFRPSLATRNGGWLSGYVLATFSFYFGVSVTHVFASVCIHASIASLVAASRLFPILLTRPRVYFILPNIMPFFLATPFFFHTIRDK